MNFLLDTHIILWAVTDDARLPEVAKFLIKDKSNQIFFSLASIWEVEIKHGLGKMPVSGKELYDECIAAGYVPLRIEVNHIAELPSLHRPENAPKHNDPFDRILLAQAKTENMRFMTHDSLIPYYNESCILSV